MSKNSTNDDTPRDRFDRLCDEMRECADEMGREFVVVEKPKSGLYDPHVLDELANALGDNVLIISGQTEELAALRGFLSMLERLLRDGATVTNYGYERETVRDVDAETGIVCKRPGNGITLSLELERATQPADDAETETESMQTDDP